MGAIAGAIAGGVSWAGGQYHVEEAIYKMAGVGLGSAANGGNMERNVQAMLFAGLGYSAHKLWNNMTPEKDKNGNPIRMTGGPRGGLSGTAMPKGEDTPPYQTNNDFGTATLNPPSPAQMDFYFSLKEGSIWSRIANLVPGLSDVSVLHDAYQNHYPDGWYRAYVINVPNMIPAAAITYAAYLDMAPTSVVMDQIK